MDINIKCYGVEDNPTPDGEPQKINTITYYSCHWKLKYEELLKMNEENLAALKSTRKALNELYY